MLIMLQGVDCWVGKRNASETTKLRSDLPYRIDQGHRQRVGSDRSVCVCVFTPGPGLGLGAHGIPSVASTFADHIWFARGSASVGRAYKGEGEQSPVSNNAQKRQMKSLTWNICKGCVAS